LRSHFIPLTWYHSRFRSPSTFPSPLPLLAAGELLARQPRASSGLIQCTTGSLWSVRTPATIRTPPLGAAPEVRSVVSSLRSDHHHPWSTLLDVDLRRRTSDRATRAGLRRRPLIPCWARLPLFGRCSRGLVRGLLTRIRPPAPSIYVAEHRSALLEQACTGHACQWGCQPIAIRSAPASHSPSALLPCQQVAIRSAPIHLLPPTGHPMLGPAALLAGRPCLCSWPVQLHQYGLT
jgi:hypothetical protein